MFWIYADVPSRQICKSFVLFPVPYHYLRAASECCLLGASALETKMWWLSPG